MTSIEYATYANEKYLPYLRLCLEGCQKLTGIMPTVYALDRPVFRQAQVWGAKVKVCKSHQNPNVASLHIIKESSADLLVLIDADCWILRNDVFKRILLPMSFPHIHGSGDIGNFDIPYLFRTIHKSDLFNRLHEVFCLFPILADRWGKAEKLNGKRLSSGCAVDIPMLYGGLAAYRTIAFREMIIPDWIHSADIWLTIFAVENDLKWEHVGKFQFNRRLDPRLNAFHLAGPKPTRKRLRKYIGAYERYLEMQSKKNE